MLTQDDDLLFQSYFTLVLIAELCNNQFLKSKSFTDMQFSSPFIKNKLLKIGIDNQGSALIALYVMLVIPKEIIFKRYTREYEDIRTFLESHTENTSSSYNSDNPKIDFLRHIRNAVAHSRIEFRPKEVIIFLDANERTGEKFKTELPLAQFGMFIQRLQSVHLKYINDLQ